ncbi:TIGR00266 family protein [Natronosalvus rutilus]|uniref:TIGR00266 family protein n=1 Tax=Natronosalvus rutilus TaxID=2953753 RepID=A0A9E7N8V9_9EURY|nr:TIGR00266 family protein [Natronosalvus rutilus]UTF52921.1 TIGR00266 family protein [Natronosalvus rutilus]
MKHSIAHRPSFALLQVDLETGESIMAEAGAMVSHTDGIDIVTSRGNDSLLGSVKRKVLGGESFFQNSFTARELGHITFAPPIPGDIVRHDLTDETLYVQSGSYLAADDSISVDTQFGGGKTLFGGEGLFLLKLSGTGPTFLSSYGAIEEKTIEPGERYVVDTGHIVAFEESLEFSVDRVGGLKSTLFSGEGLVCTFEGPGTLWLQSRSQDAFLSWLIPQLPTSDN